MELEEFILLALEEDIRDGDHTSLSCISSTAEGRARLLVKEDGIIAGINIAKAIFHEVDQNIVFEPEIKDGDVVKCGDIVFTVQGKSQSILMAERLALNCMQRMSAIATKTNKVVQLIGNLKTKVLDTRKTTPLLRFMEKEAVRIGGGVNHRFGLYDMIMIKDNHIDYAGGIPQAIEKTLKYLKEKKLDLRIEVEARNLEEVQTILNVGQIHRIMFDNFSYDDIKTGVKMVNGKYETEASGGINMETVRNYAECGVDFVSMGALTHSIYNMDLSLKAH